MKILKTTIITLLILLINSVSYQAQKDSVYLIKEVDELSDEVYFYANRRFVVSNKDNSVGFIVDAYIGEKITFDMITVKMVNIGSCNEKDEIIILLDNGKKIIKTSWKKFNCDGETYFDLTKEDIQLLRESELNTIRMTNGRTYDSYTGKVNQKDKRYFIQLIYALDNKLITIK
jgi:hypothetical protein